MPLRLTDAALTLLAERGAAAVTVRAVETAAGAPHGSVRHHFGGLDGLRTALVDALLRAEQVPAGDEADPDLDALVGWWTGDGAPIAAARYEVMLMAGRDEQLRRTFLLARDALVARLAARGLATGEAEAMVAMLDGLVQDALLRRRPPDLGPWKRALAALGTTPA